MVPTLIIFNMDKRGEEGIKQEERIQFPNYISEHSYFNHWCRLWLTFLFNPIGVYSR